MEFEKLPVGFAMALAQNRKAMESFASMPDEQKQTIIDKAHHVQDKGEVGQIMFKLEKQG